MTGFAFALLVLLSIPGPTNVLLATAGATIGWGKAQWFVFPVVGGYLIAIGAWLWLTFALARVSQTAALGLRLTCTAYLIFAAWKLWNRRPSLTNDQPLRWHDLFLVTLFNPKALIVALIVEPTLTRSPASLLLYVFVFVIICVPVSCGWIGVGVSVDSVTASKVSTKILSRVSSVVLAGFAAAIGLASVGIGR